MQVIILFFIFTLLCFIFSYYYNLLISQSVYTRNELINIIPRLGSIFLKIFFRYSFFYLIIFYLISGFTSMLILSLFDNWLINSALIPFILYFAFPRLALYFEQTRVTISENFNDILESFFIKYYTYILLGFFSGYSSKLIDNWINYNFIPFYWFLINFVIITAITVIILRKEIID